ncbi:hypothetical protein MUP01_03655 [Candidatus Bathyarchaeota archaeon]|nr:hypothetical protein [Candidatus Bathyarchaeota archaeon]
MSGKNRSEKKLVTMIVVLMRNTTWRCGRLERLIVKNLHSRHSKFGKSEVQISDMIQNFKVTGKTRNDFLDAIRRLERRNIIRTLSLVK